MYALSQDKVHTIQQKGMTIRAKILVHVAADTVVYIPSCIHQKAFAHRPTCIF